MFQFLNWFWQLAQWKKKKTFHINHLIVSNSNSIRKCSRCASANSQMTELQNPVIATYHNYSTTWLFFFFHNNHGKLQVITNNITNLILELFYNMLFFAEKELNAFIWLQNWKKKLNKTAHIFLSDQLHTLHAFQAMPLKKHCQKKSIMFFFVHTLLNASDTFLNNLKCWVEFWPNILTWKQAGLGRQMSTPRQKLTFEKFCHVLFTPALFSSFYMHEK